MAKEARGVSAITLIKTARTQILAAKEHEARGDLRTAFGSYIKAATLAKMTMDSPEYLMEAKGKGGVVRRELNDFLEVGLWHSFEVEALLLRMAHSSSLDY